MKRCILTIAALAALAPTPALAADGRGKTTLTRSAQGLEISAGRPATTSASRLTLPVRSGELDPVPSLRHGGTIKLRATRGAKAITLRRIELKLGSRPVMSASIAGKRRSLMRVKLAKRKLTIDRSTGSVVLRDGKLQLSQAGRRFVRRKLRFERVPQTLGRLSIEASVGSAPGGGSGAPGQPKSGALSAEPPRLARPASAADVSAVSIAWHPRDSWIRYVNTGTGPNDGVFASTGATAGATSTASPCPDRPSSGDAQLVYSFNYAAAASWYDQSSGVAGIYGAGKVRFRWVAHTIDLTANDPEVEINGAASRVIFRFQGSGGTVFPDQRAVLMNLALTGQPTVSPDGKTFSYSLMRGRLTKDGEAVFAGFYTAPDNNDFGCVSVSFTTP